MWKLYDELYIGIPSGIRIDKVEIDAELTRVYANGNVGVAKTMELPENAEELAAGFKGRFLRETTGHLYWPTEAHASVGVAAMNAWYNTPERIAALSVSPSDTGNARVISSDALISRELPKLLEGAEGVVLEGDSLPCTPLFFAFGSPVREVRGKGFCLVNEKYR